MHDQLDLSKMVGLKHCSILYSYVKVRLPSSVTSLDLRYGLGLQSAYVLFPEGFSSLTCLRILSAARWNSHAENLLIKILLANQHQLETFSCQDAETTGTLLWRLLKEGYFDQLRKLELTRTKVDDDFLCMLSQHCLQLTDLSITSSPLVTGAGIKPLVTKKGEPLRYLDVSGCNAIARDAIDLCVSRGIRVIYGSLADAPAGRKVRY